MVSLALDHTLIARATIFDQLPLDRYRDLLGSGVRLSPDTIPANRAPEPENRALPHSELVPQ